MIPPRPQEKMCAVKKQAQEAQGQPLEGLSSLRGLSCLRAWVVVTTHLALKGSLCLRGPQKMTVMRESLALTLSFPCLPHIQSR